MYLQSFGILILNIARFIQKSCSLEANLTKWTINNITGTFRLPVHDVDWYMLSSETRRRPYTVHVLCFPHPLHERTMLNQLIWGRPQAVKGDVTHAQCVYKGNLLTSAHQSKVPDTEWTTFNPLKTIWFCYNTHFPQIPARVYSGLVFNGLIDIETRCLGKTNITFSHWLKNSYMRRTHWGYWSSALSETAWIHMKDFCVVPFWIELTSQTCHMIFLHALNWLKLLEWVQCGTKSPKREGKFFDNECTMKK